MTDTNKAENDTENKAEESKKTRVQFPKNTTAQEMYDHVKKLQQDWEKRHGRKVGTPPPPPPPDEKP